MPFAADRIAQSLADFLAPVIPEQAGVTLTALGPVLRLDDGRAFTEVDLSKFGEGERLSDLEAETATSAALSTIQDVISEALTVFWPGPDALPDAAVHDGILSASFGPEAAPALRLDRIAESSPSSDPDR